MRPKSHSLASARAQRDRALVRSREIAPLKELPFPLATHQSIQNILALYALCATHGNLASIILLVKGIVLSSWWVAQRVKALSSQLENYDILQTLHIRRHDNIQSSA